MNLIHNANNYVNPFSASQWEARGDFWDGNKINTCERIIILVLTIFVTLTTAGLAASTVFKFSVDRFKALKQTDDLSEDADASKIGNIYFNLHVELGKLNEMSPSESLVEALRRYPSLCENREFMLNFAKVEPALAFFYADPQLQCDVDFVQQLKQNVASEDQLAFDTTIAPKIFSYIEGVFKEADHWFEDALQGNSVRFEVIYEFMRHNARKTALEQLKCKWNEPRMLTATTVKDKLEERVKKEAELIERKINEVTNQLLSTLGGVDKRLEKRYYDKQLKAEGT